MSKLTAFACGMAFAALIGGEGVAALWFVSAAVIWEFA